MVDVRKYLAPRFVKVTDVAEGPMRVTVDGVQEGAYGKLDVSFVENYKLSLNATNSRVLAMALGHETDRWRGRVVELYCGEVCFKGTSQAAVLVRVPSAERLPESPKVKATVAGPDDDIPF